jgi:hypothetical protein
MSKEPLMIPFARVREIVESLGADINNTLSVTFGLDGVSVEQVRTDPETGRSVAAGDNLATVTTVIGYDRTDGAR